MPEKNIYRGDCAGLAAINQVDIDLSSLVEEIAPAFPGEPAKRVFPVRTQLTWFRLKNEKGNIVTEITDRDEFAVTVNATVYTDEGCRVSNAHGSADATNDGVYGFKLVETAESRAISRALDFAGYGCQLDLKTFEGNDPGPGASGNERPAPVGNGDTQFPNEAPPAPQPGTFKGKQKVDANAPSGIVDISEIEKSDPPAAKKGRGKKREAENTAGGEQPPASGADSGNGTEGNPANTADSPKSPAKEAEETQPKDEPGAATEGVSGGAGDTRGVASMASVGNLAEAADSGKSVETRVMEYIAAATVGGAPELDPVFFAEGTAPGDLAKNGKGAELRMTNLELQLAILFFQANPDAIRGVMYPAKEGTSLYGKTFGDILAGDSSTAVIKSCVNLYNKDNVAAYAASLVLFSGFPKEEDSNDK